MARWIDGGVKLGGGHTSRKRGEKEAKQVQSRECIVSADMLDLAFRAVPFQVGLSVSVCVSL